MWRLGLAMWTGCGLVFPLEDPPIIDLFASCRDPEFLWGQAQRDLVGASFDSTFQAVESPTVLDDIMLYVVTVTGVASEVSHAQHDDSADQFVNVGVTVGPTSFKPSSRPQLWRNGSGERRLFFAGTEPAGARGVPFEGVPGLVDGRDWEVSKISLPASLTDRGTVVFGTPGLAGSRVIVEIEETGELVELERSPQNQFTELVTTARIGAARHPRMAPDGCWMVFSQPDSGGVHDLMIAVRNPDGTFASPQILSEVTPTFDERDPYVTEDGGVLYFSHVDLDVPTIQRRIFNRRRAP